MPDPEPEKKAETMKETVARLKTEHPIAHPTGCGCWVCKSGPGGI